VNLNHSLWNIPVKQAQEQHERIKMRLRLAGSSLACVARELGVAATTVTSVSQGARRSRRIEALIAAKLGLRPAQLWPDRYARLEAPAMHPGGDA
jgi:Ner family transcriptional regulator